MKNNEVIKVKSRMFFRIWLFFVIGGVFIVGVWLVFEVFIFEFKYFLFYLGGGLMVIVYGLIIFFMVFLVFISWGNVIFSVKIGFDGEIFLKKCSVCFFEIKWIYMGWYYYSLKGIFFEDIIIEKIDGKVVCIFIWNIIVNLLFFEVVECYIFFYLSDEVKNNWIG